MKRDLSKLGVAVTLGVGVRLGAEESPLVAGVRLGADASPLGNCARRLSEPKRRPCPPARMIAPTITQACASVGTVIRGAKPGGASSSWSGRA